MNRVGIYTPLHADNIMHHLKLATAVLPASDDITCGYFIISMGSAKEHRLCCL